MEAIIIENRYVITLDFKQKSIFHVNFVQGNINTSVLEFRIVDGGQPVDISNQEVSVAFLKPDNTLVIQDSLTGVSILDGPNGKLQCILSPNTLAAVGIVKGEVNFDSEGTKLSTVQFIFNVTVSLDNGDILMSINELPKLDAKLIDIQAQYNDDSTQWDSDVNNVIALATNKITETETARQAAITATNDTNTAISGAQTATTNANNAVATISDMYTNPKGVKATYAELPSSGNVKGDSWHVSADPDTSKNGHWRWNGTTWIPWYRFNPSGIPTVASLNDVDKALAGLVRRQMHSGVVTYLPITTGSTTNLNSITIPETTYNVNGFEIKMPLAVLTLPDPPTSGSREDLVFLETYFPADGNGYTMAGRYRTVAGVDFILLPEGLGARGSSYMAPATPQGGNISPIGLTTNWNFTFIRDGHTEDGSSIATNRQQFIGDKSLYVAGIGDSTSKTTLQTFDGYSYAIPLFRVKRRNSGGYSPSNPNGAKNWVPIKFAAAVSVVAGYTFTATLLAGQGQYVSAGDRFLWNGTSASVYGDIISVSGDTITFISSYTGTFNAGGDWFAIKSKHPQSFYSNVISKDDIEDLRHRVQVQYNYDYELKKAFDQFMRSEIGSQKKLMKVYHGIPKSEIDEHTVFYASLDETTIAEVGGATGITGTYKPMPTGSGLLTDEQNVSPIPLSGISSEGTVSLWIDFDSVTSSSSPTICNLNSGIGNPQLNIWIPTSGSINFGKLLGDYVISNINTSYNYPKGKHFMSFTFKNGQPIKIYQDGVLKASSSQNYDGSVTITQMSIANRVDNVRDTKILLSDVHISNVDRGSLFPQLPPDFISGDAVIMPAYTDQRKINSEAQMSQTTVGIAKGAGTGHNRGITATQATPGVWASGDTIKVTGMAGEIVSGVIDVDTALSMVVKDAAVGATTVFLDDVSKLVVGDSVLFVYSRISSAGFNTARTITTIDSVNKSISFDAPLSSALVSNISFIIEFTTPSSLPLINFLSSGTKTAVAGAWTPSTIGTNQATFTLGTNTTLTNQDIQIDYSLIMPAGQPALTAPTTATLMGEAGMRIPYDKQTITSDFAGKISASMWTNPNTAKTLSSIVANNPAPSTFIDELITSEYAKMYTQDGTVTTFSTSVVGEQACVLLSFDLIKIVERTLGCKIPGKTKADKVAWLKRNLDSTANRTICRVAGFGSSPSGNKLSLTIYGGVTWSSTITTNTTGLIATILRSNGDTSTITSDGFVYYLAYADPSDGVTPSVISIGHASIDIKFADKVTNSFKLVNGTLAVRDDFAGKIVDSIIENPNTMKRTPGGASGPTSLLAPSGAWTVFDQTRYDIIKYLDNIIDSTANSGMGSIAQYLLSFNLIRIIEDKYGPIPAIDKVQWLKDNLASVTCNWWGYGGGPLGNKANFTLWRVDSPSWNTPKNHTNSSVTKITYSINSTMDAWGNIVNNIDANGFIYFLAYADPSDGVTPSTIYTDYCNIELTLKTSTGYDILVPENPRRDAGQSAILFVRKETKEVQSLFPYTNEYLLASYSEYLPAPDPISANTEVTILAEIPEFLVTDLGSAVGHKQGVHHWMNPAYRVGQDKLELYGELGFSSVPFAPDSVGINVGAKVITTAIGFASLTKAHGLNGIIKPLTLVYRALVLINGELKLLIYSHYTSSGLNEITGTAGAIRLLPIIGKPLSKESDGLLRNMLSPKYWRTNPLVVEGFVDKATNKLITTNNSI